MSDVIDAERFPRLAERLARKPPNGKVARIHEFAKDLAIGFEEGVWGSIMSYALQGDGTVVWNIHEPFGKSELETTPKSKWSNELLPDFNAMCSLGYLILDEQNSSTLSKAYTLSGKALRLVDESVTPPNVFISYKRSESSAFALLLEARIKYETTATPFMDKSIEPGDDWHPQLEEKVNSCETFVCVIGPSTLDSPYVQNEIRWAQSNGKNSLILPVWHNEYAGSHPNDTLKGKQAVIVGGENAKNYDSAVNEVLNRLGYSPQFIAQRQNV